MSNAFLRALALPASLCLVLGLASCSNEEAPSSEPEETPTVAEPSDHASSAPAAEPSERASSTPAAEPRNVDVIYLAEDAPDVAWHGSLVGAASWNDFGISVTGWQPGMTDFAACELEVLESDEQPAEDLGVDRSVDVIGTESGDAYLLYAAKQSSSGLTAEETHVYLQGIDLTSCSAEKRSEITTVPDGLVASAPAFAGVSGDVVAISPYAWVGGELPDTPALFGIDTSSGESVWTESFPGKLVKIRADYSESGQQVPSVFDLGIADSSGLEDRSLREVATGSAVAEATDFESPSLIVGDGFVFTDASGDFPYSQTSLTDGTLSPVSGGFLSGEAVSAVDRAGVPVAVGPMCLESDAECPVTNPDRSLGYVGADHAVHEILSADQVESLQVSFLGASSGRVYFTTTSENLIADFNGDLIGEPYDSDEYPFAPIAERVVDGDAWTLWVTQEGILSIGQERYAISKDGEFPKAP